ncbi:hypothetical protein S245_056972, partial [Arachis hypogaea]
TSLPQATIHHLLPSLSNPTHIGFNSFFFLSSSHTYTDDADENARLLWRPLDSLAVVRSGSGELKRGPRFSDFLNFL